MRIVVDTMGGDHAPVATISGAVDALQDDGNDDVEIILVGDAEAIRSELRHHHSSDRIYVEHAEQVISMKESPTKAIKDKPDSSIAKGIGLLKAGDAEGFVSAGNTGAVLTSSLLSLGRIPGVNRPTIGSYLPNIRGGCTIFDVGANPDAKPVNLLQFAIMGSIYTKHVFGIENPRVGLLNIGEERTKGNNVVIDAYGMLEQEVPNFIGNIEGREILHGKADLVICDGFVGNILLKFGESVFDAITEKAKYQITNKPFATVGALLMKPVVKKIAKEFNYEEYGGVPLLGINGVSIIGHGSSSPKAIKNAIGVARTMVQKQINQIIKEEIKAHRIPSPSIPHVDDPLIPQG